MSQWYWPMMHVIHSHLLTHLTHDPWPTDPLSALVHLIIKFKLTAGWGQAGRRGRQRIYNVDVVVRCLTGAVWTNQIWQQTASSAAETFNVQLRHSCQLAVHLPWSANLSRYLDLQFNCYQYTCIPLKLSQYRSLDRFKDCAVCFVSGDAATRQYWTPTDGPLDDRLIYAQPLLAEVSFYSWRKFLVVNKHCNGSKWHRSRWPHHLPRILTRRTHTFCDWRLTFVSLFLQSEIHEVSKNWQLLYVTCS